MLLAAKVQRGKSRNAVLLHLCADLIGATPNKIRIEDRPIASGWQEEHPFGFGSLFGDTITSPANSSNIAIKQAALKCIR